MCSFADEGLLNARIKAGWNSRQVNDWLRTHYDGLAFDRKTIYTHKREHLGRPEDRLVTAVAKTQAREATLPRATTNEQFLEAIRDVGYQRAILHPDEVTIDHSLKATQILVGAKSQGGNTLIILAKIMTGAMSPELSPVVDGEFVEVSP